MNPIPISKKNEPDKYKIRDIHLPPTDIQKLESKGYELMRKLGEGNTRIAYKAIYRSGALIKERVIKIPKRRTGQESLTTVINLSKRNVNENEIIRCNDIKHQNIIELHDSLELSTGTATVENFFNAVSLEDTVENIYFRESNQLMPNKRFLNISNQIIDAVKYLHNGPQVLHRDIKPSNILIGLEDKVKITDFQNAERRCNISKKSLPTRGGTAFSHPELLNALIGGEGMASKKTDIYGIGASLYHMLTGFAPFDYKIKEDKSGVPIIVDNKRVFVSLFSKGKKIEKITKESHEKELKKILKQINRRYRPILKKGLSFDKGYTSIFQLKKDIDKIKLTNWDKFLNQAKRKVEIAAMTALITIFASSSVYFLYNSDINQIAPTTLHNIISHQNHRLKFRTLGAAVLDNNITGNLNTLKLLYNYKNIKISQNNQDGIDSALTYRGPDKINMRAIVPLIRSILVEKDRHLINFDSTRTKYALIPHQFYTDMMNGHSSSDDPDKLEQWKEVFFMMRYIQHCYKHGDSISDLYVKALLSNDEISNAIAKTQNFTMFNHITKNKYEFAGEVKNAIINLKGDTGSSYLPKTVKGSGQIFGYGPRVDPIRKRIIDRAIALYSRTNQDGTLNLPK